MGPLLFAFISPRRSVDCRKGRSLSYLTIGRVTEFRRHFFSQTITYARTLPPPIRFHYRPHATPDSLNVGAEVKQATGAVFDRVSLFGSHLVVSPFPLCARRPVKRKANRCSLAG